MTEQDGYHDSVRGIPGWFMPVADVPVDKITPAEASHYSAFQQSIDREVGRFVPVVAAVQRLVSEDGKLDRIAAEVHVAPFSQSNIAKWAKMLGPAEANRVAPIKGDVASLEVIADALGQSVHLFGGLRDFRTPLVVRQGEARPALSPTEFIRGYIGTWPRPLEILETFLGRPTGPPDAQGLSQNDGMFNLWQRRTGDFFLFSFHRDVLMEVGPQLAMVEARATGADSAAYRRPLEQGNRDRRQRPRLHADARRLGQRQPVHELAHERAAHSGGTGSRRGRAPRRRSLCRSARAASTN